MARLSNFCLIVVLLAFLYQLSFEIYQSKAYFYFTGELKVFALSEIYTSYFLWTLGIFHVFISGCLVLFLTVIKSTSCSTCAIKSFLQSFHATFLFVSYHGPIFIPMDFYLTITPNFPYFLLIKSV